MGAGRGDLDLLAGVDVADVDVGVGLQVELRAAGVDDPLVGVSAPALAVPVLAGDADLFVDRPVPVADVHVLVGVQVVGELAPVGRDGVAAAPVDEDLVAPGNVPDPDPPGDAARVESHAVAAGGHAHRPEVVVGRGLVEHRHVPAVRVQRPERLLPVAGEDDLVGNAPGQTDVLPPPGGQHGLLRPVPLGPHDLPVGPVVMGVNDPRPVRREHRRGHVVLDDLHRAPQHLEPQLPDPPELRPAGKQHHPLHRIRRGGQDQEKNQPGGDPQHRPHCSRKPDSGPFPCLAACDM